MTRGIEPGTVVSLSEDATPTPPPTCDKHSMKFLLQSILSVLWNLVYLILFMSSLSLLRDFLQKPAVVVKLDFSAQKSENWRKIPLPRESAIYFLGFQAIKTESEHLKYLN